MAHRVLVVDDDPDLLELLAAELEAEGFRATACDRGQRALELLEAEEFDVILSDVRMPEMSGLEFCQRAAEVRPDLPVLVMTAFASLASAIEAIQAGAYDYLVKPVAGPAVALRLRRVIREFDNRREVRRLRRIVADANQQFDMVGTSEPMKSLFDLIGRVAASDTSVLITGESGTGKELVAHALHQGSERQNGPFLPINCAALPETLLESELFGHTAGAFTGAGRSRIGLFAEVSGGTLFLDEIGEMPLALQPKLLRVLEEKVVRPLGSERDIPVDFRLVCATNADLEAAIAESRFREDLYYRIHVLQIELPPLRERGSDILLLARHFQERQARLAGKELAEIEPVAAEKLLAYPWPGNVRELRNCIERAVALATGNRIRKQDLPERIRSSQRRADRVVPVLLDELVAMDEVERRYIAHIMAAVGGNKTAAARILGFDRTTLYRKLERFSEPGSTS